VPADVSHLQSITGDAFVADPIHTNPNACDGFYSEDDRSGDVSGANPEEPLLLIPLERLTVTE
jgi:hypothetical protein